MSDIITLERLQKRATKFILGNSKTNYKSRLSKLEMLPLMYRFEMYDIMFLINSYNNRLNMDHFNILHFVSLSDSNTRSAHSFRLKHPAPSDNLQRHSYFYRLPRLWNLYLQSTLKTLLPLFKHMILSHFITHFLSHFISETVVPTTTSVVAIHARPHSLVVLFIFINPHLLIFNHITGCQCLLLAILQISSPFHLLFHFITTIHSMYMLLLFCKTK